MSALPPAPWGKPWFYQKMFGSGTGLPCSWEGWIALVGFIVAISGWGAFANTRLPGGQNSPLGWAVTLALLAVIIVVAWGRTSGGWSRRVRR